MTVRRDLQRLEEQGLLRRVHGGATRVVFLYNRHDLPGCVAGLMRAAASIDHSDALIITPTGATTINLLTEEHADGRHAMRV